MKEQEEQDKSKLKASLYLAEERTDLVFRNIDETINEILIEFKSVKERELLKAIRNGALGKYGRSYRLSTQEVCFWIRSLTQPKQDRL